MIAPRIAPTVSRMGLGEGPLAPSEKPTKASPTVQIQTLSLMIELQLGWGAYGHEASIRHTILLLAAFAGGEASVHRQSRTAGACVRARGGPIGLANLAVGTRGDHTLSFFDAHHLIT